MGSEAGALCNGDLGLSAGGGAKGDGPTINHAHPAQDGAGRGEKRHD